MNIQFKPKGYTSVSPYFILNGAQKFIDLLKIVFDAKELRRFENPDGTKVHTEIQIDDSVIMLGDSSDKFPPITLVMHVYVPDADATFKRAIDAGCEIVEQPKQEWYIFANDSEGKSWSTLCGRSALLSVYLSPEKTPGNKYKRAELRSYKASKRKAIRELKFIRDNEG